ncbi:MAG: gas vesicle protein [Actinomycetota bacterium]|nr:gas vesicle protein [Actinomycetota bacterium]
MTTTDTVRADVEVAEGRALGQLSLVDLLDRLLGSGVVLSGDIVISLSGVDLVQIRLHALIATIRADMAGPR